jgi:hypothetical protein
MPELQDLDYMNNWKDTPYIVRMCQQSQHKTESYETDHNCVIEIKCPICNYKYRIDSSD